MKGDLSGYWSVHIDQKNRIVFRIDGEENLEIIQCGTHYGDR
ncbi:MAG: type II toxin-antitoxin system YoeB family toxin [Dialister sp.]|nr:type II toxin-antitoxin system YoeB family toxin [Dialister sp.]